MSGLRTKRVVWTVVFLSITLAAIVMEVVAGVWHPMGTIPWTEYLARYVPWPIQLGAYVALAAWLPVHFWRHDHLRRAAYQDGYNAASRYYVPKLRDGNEIGYADGYADGKGGRPNRVAVAHAAVLMSGQTMNGETRFRRGRSDGR